MKPRDYAHPSPVRVVTGFPDGSRMRYVIYGAGAIGGTIGGRLIEAGHDVALIARGAHLAELRRTGLRLQRPDADNTHAVEAFGSPAEAAIDADDVVVTAMKTQHSAAALEELAAVAPPDIPIVCAQNGVESERLALRRFPRVYAMCVVVPADHLEPGVVRAYGSPNSGILDLGRYPVGIDDLARRIADDLDAAGFSSRTVADPMRSKYGKLVSNLQNALEALAGQEARDSELTARVRAEARNVLAAAGIDLTTPEEDERRREGVMTRRPIGEVRRGGSSSWQSLARGTGSIETDYLNGEIALLGRLHGVPTPLNAAIQYEARQAARNGAPPASLSIAELTRRLSAA